MEPVTGAIPVVPVLDGCVTGTLGAGTETLGISTGLGAYLGGSGFYFNVFVTLTVTMTTIKSPSLIPRASRVSVLTVFLPLNTNFCASTSKFFCYLILFFMSRICISQ
jgi:hypothetical protein